MTPLHDLRGMVRGARKRHRRAHREMTAHAVRVFSSPPGRLYIEHHTVHIAGVHRALQQLHDREQQLRTAEFDRFVRNGFNTRGRA